MLESEARSRAGGHFFMSEPPCDPTKPPTLDIPLNGPVHSICEVLHTVMALAAEAEIGVLFSSTQKGEELHLALMEMGHPNPQPQ
eukprot:2156535-Ditylum_brightwellii.AAC.1